MRSHVPQLCFLLLPSLTRNYLTAHMRHARPHLLFPKAKHDLTCPHQTYSVYLRETGILRSSPSPCRLRAQLPGPQCQTSRGCFIMRTGRRCPAQPNCGATIGPYSQFCAIYGRVCMWISRVSCACAEWSSSIGTFPPISDRIVVAPCSSPCPCLP